MHRELHSVISEPLAWRHAHFRPRHKAAFLSSLLALTPHIYLTSLDLSSLPSLTDAELHSILLYTSDLTSLSLSSNPLLSNLSFLSLTRLTSSRLLHLALPTDTAAHLDVVCLSLLSLSSPPLTSLHLSHTPYLPPDCLLHLSPLSSLTRLTLRSLPHITPSSFSFLSLNTTPSHRRRPIWPLLHSLDVRGCTQLTDVTLALFARLPTLTSLDVGGCQRVTAEGVEALSGEGSLCREQLRELVLDGCSGVTDQCAAALLDLPALTALSLDHCASITPQVLLVLAAHPSLQRLVFCHQHRCALGCEQEVCSCEMSTKEAVHALRAFVSSCSSLTSLSLRHFQLDDEQMAEVWSGRSAPLSSLTLHIHHFAQSLSFLRHPAFHHLHTLEVECNPHRPTHLTPMEACAVTLPHLRRLSLRGCTLSGASFLNAFAASSRLLYLDLSGAGYPTTVWPFTAAHFPLLGTLRADFPLISHDGLLSLSRLPHLHTLTLCGHHLSPTDLSAFTPHPPPTPIPFPSLQSLSFTAAPHVDVSAWRLSLRHARGGDDGLQVMEDGEERRRRDEEEDEDEDWEPPDVTTARRMERDDEEGDAEVVSGDEEEEEEEHADADVQAVS